MTATCISSLWKNIYVSRLGWTFDVKCDESTVAYILSQNMVEITTFVAVHLMLHTSLALLQLFRQMLRGTGSYAHALGDHSELAVG